VNSGLHNRGVDGALGWPRWNRKHSELLSIGTHRRCCCLLRRTRRKRRARPFYYFSLHVTQARPHFGAQRYRYHEILYDIRQAVVAASGRAAYKRPLASVLVSRVVCAKGLPQPQASPPTSLGTPHSTWLTGADPLTSHSRHRQTSRKDRIIDALLIS
jgi:hypothetical protein